MHARACAPASRASLRVRPAVYDRHTTTQARTPNARHFFAHNHHQSTLFSDHPPQQLLVSCCVYYHGVYLLCAREYLRGAASRTLRILLTYLLTGFTW